MDFPIPLDYVIYRAIFYFVKDIPRDSFDGLDLFDAAGISRESREIFRIMEHRFLLFIKGNRFTMPELYSIMGKRTISRVGVFTQISLSFFMGSLVLLLIMIIMGRPIIQGVTSHLPLIIYIGIFVTGVGYLCLNLAVKMSDATTGSISFFIKPAIAPIFAVLLLKESVLWNTVVGILFLISASFLTLYDAKRNQSPS